MLAEIISIGDEILIGQIVNTNAVFMAKALNKIGVEVVQITTISDRQSAIVKALDEAQERAQIILMTGGLGPTKDDLTKHTLTAYFNDELVLYPEVLEAIEEMFRKYVPTPINDENRKQALLPAKARILPNRYGTASGMWFENNGGVVVSLPGVPFEMKALVNDHVLPALQAHFTLPYIYHRTLLTYGLGESVIAERIQAWENNLPDDIKLAYLPNLGRVRLRLSGKGNDKALLEQRIEAQIQQLLPLIDDIFAGYEDQSSLEEQLLHRFVARGETLAVAESCTGGEIAARLTKVPGASGCFKGGVVAYHTQSKVDLLKVDPQLIEKHQVVSEEVATAMALGVQAQYNTSYAVATTGNAGPKKGEADAPVGTVCMAFVTPQEVITHTFEFGNHRERVIQKAVNTVFEIWNKISG